MSSLVNIYILVVMIALEILMAFNIFFYKKVQDGGGTPDISETTCTTMLLFHIISAVIIGFFIMWSAYDLLFCGIGKKCKRRIDFSSMI